MSKLTPAQRRKIGALIATAFVEQTTQLKMQEHYWQYCYDNTQKWDDDALLFNAKMEKIQLPE